MAVSQRAVKKQLNQFPTQQVPLSRDNGNRQNL
jgi:hypothetical protein